MPLFWIPLSGLTAASSALSVIANNLANVNTDGFKEQSTTFRDLFYQTAGTSGSGNPIQIGNGVQVQSVHSNFTDGSLDNTGVPTDMAISGSGFFVTQKDGSLQYTRAGNFGTNSAGQLITDDGQFVLGYQAVGGQISTSAPLGPLYVGKGVTSPTKATTSVQMSSNLDAGAAVGSSFSTPLQVHDSLGTSHVLTFNFTKTGANAWNYDITIPAGEVGATGTTSSVATGSLTFDSNGKLTAPAANVSGINIAGLVDGASAMNLTWNLYDTSNQPTITQFSAQSATSTTYQDGYGSGSLQSFMVDSSGVIQGTFTNGHVMPLGQIALATFSNLQGLNKAGANAYVPTLASGDAVIGMPGSGGRGTISGGTLELSNVDIATEFAKMIVAQRGYQANAKVVTSFDQISQDTINLVR